MAKQNLDIGNLNLRIRVRYSKLNDLSFTKMIINCTLTVLILIEQILASLRNENNIFLCQGPFNTEQEVSVLYLFHCLCLSSLVGKHSFHPMFLKSQGCLMIHESFPFMAKNNTFNLLVLLQYHVLTLSSLFYFSPSPLNH